MAYIYEPLDSAGRHLRFLTLIPSKETADLQAVLETHLIDECPPYQFVSFRWESPDSSPHEIIVNGVAITITDNIWKCLMHLKPSSGASQPLFVDTICVNQEDISERTGRIRLAHDIIARAERNIVWLGDIESSPKELWAFGEVERSVSSLLSNQRAAQGGKLLADLADAITQLDADTPVNLSNSLLRLCRSQHWTGIWLVPELIRAKAILVAWRDGEMQWESLASYFEASATAVKIAGNRSTVPPELGLLAITYPFQIWRLRNEYRSSSTLDLFRLLSIFRDSPCYDTRDKVYALMGLTEQRMKVGVDYSGSIWDLFYQLISLLRQRPDARLSDYKVVMDCLAVNTDRVTGPVDPRPAVDHLNYLGTCRTARLRGRVMRATPAIDCDPLGPPEMSSRYISSRLGVGIPTDDVDRVSQWLDTHTCQCMPTYDKSLASCSLFRNNDALSGSDIGITYASIDVGDLIYSIPVGGGEVSLAVRAFDSGGTFTIGRVWILPLQRTVQASGEWRTEIADPNNIEQRDPRVSDLVSAATANSNNPDVRHTPIHLSVSDILRLGETSYLEKSVPNAFVAAEALNASKMIKIHEEHVTEKDELSSKPANNHLAMPSSRLSSWKGVSILGSDAARVPRTEDDDHGARGADISSANSAEELLRSSIGSPPGLTEDVSPEAYSTEDGLEVQILPFQQGRDPQRMSQRPEDEGLSGHADDLQSLHSFNDDTVSQWTSERPALTLLAEVRLGHLLANEPTISRICSEALSKMDKLRLRRNLRRLLKSYHQSLRLATTSSLQRNAVAILQRSKAQDHVAQTILEVLAPENDESLQHIEQQVEVSAPNIEDWLVRVGDRLDVEEALDEKQAVPLPDVSGRNDSDSDGSGSGSDNDSPDKEDLPNVLHLEGFFKSGSPFQELLAKMQMFLIPAALSPLTRILMTIPAKRIWFMSNFDQSYADRFKQSFERLSGSVWDWWPLSPSAPALPDDVVRIYWRCHCFSVLWQDVDKTEAEKFQSLLDVRCSYLEYGHSCLNLNTLPRSQEALPKLMRTALSRWQAVRSPTPEGQTVRPGAPGSAPTPPSQVVTTSSSSSQPMPPVLAGLSPVTSASSSASGSTVSTQPTSASSITINIPTRLYILFAVAGGRPTLDLAHLITKGLATDGQLFTRLKTDYRLFRGKQRHWFSIWRLSHCDFVKFEKFRPNHFTSRGPSLPSSLDYQYNPRHPHAEMPPISIHEFQASFSACTSDCLLSFFHRCYLPSSATTALSRIPKKTSEWHIRSANDNCEYAWGLEARAHISALRVLVYNILMLLAPFAFWAAWQGKHPTDMQNASVPATFVIGLITLFWTLSGVIKVLSEPIKVR